jgi:hypothetical protein
MGLKLLGELNYTNYIADIKTGWAGVVYGTDAYRILVGKLQDKRVHL